MWSRWIGVAVAGCAVLTSAGCGWNGVNSLPLPGTVGTSDGGYTITVEIPNVGTLSQNSPVFIDDVEVGSVGAMTVQNFHASVRVRLAPKTVVPANAEPTVGQTSLLGSMHLSLDPPQGVAPEGRMAPGTVVPVSRGSAYPSTEETLASVSAVVNGGGLGQLGGIIRSLNDAFANGRTGDVRSLLSTAGEFISTLDRQRADLVQLLDQARRFSTDLAQQDQVLDEALTKVPPALKVLQDQTPKILTALDRLRVFSDTTSGVVNDVQSDLVTNLRHLQPTLRALADVGPTIDSALSEALVFPLGQNTIDTAVKGDYINLHAVIDLTVPRLQRELFLGTPLGNENAELLPGPLTSIPYKRYAPLNPLLSPIDPSGSRTKP